MDSNETKQEMFMQRIANGKWANFLVDATIQHAVKNGFTNIKFPVGETAAIVENHESARSEKKDKEERVPHLGRLKLV